MTLIESLDLDEPSDVCYHNYKPRLEYMFIHGTKRTVRICGNCGLEI